MKRIVSIFFLFVLVTTSLKQYYPYLDYSINKDYISKYLCENIDKPELGCEGKCHLNKQLEKSKVKQNNGFPIPSYSEEYSSVLFYQFDISISFDLLSEVYTNKSIYISNFVSYLYFDIPTPPPKFS